jgi:dihydroorotate dehydrogenase (fumarate)
MKGADMDLTTTYLGMTLRSPLVASACPLWDNVDNIARAEEAGASAVVLYSLFEEQIRREREAMHHYLLYGTYSFAEALTYFPEPIQYHTGTDGYLELIRKAKERVSIPVIASINGATLGGWTTFARRMEQAGADAIELNIYSIPTDPFASSTEVEENDLEIVKSVQKSVNIPVAVKLSPFFSNMAYMARRFDEAGASALVLFNRFYQPDIDLETLEVRPNVLLSTQQSLRLPLRWIAILYGKLKADLAGTGGVHVPEDVVKMLMAGASVTMMASALLRNGIGYLRTMEDGLKAWMEAHEYESVTQMRGSMSQINVSDPSSYERAQYMRALSEYKVLV